MPRVYSVQFDNISVAAAQDLFGIAPASGKTVRILGFNIDPVGGVADVGDAEEENLRLQLIRGHTTVGSGGAAVTPVPLDAIDTAAGATGRRNDTTVATAGTAANLWSGSLSVRAGVSYMFPEKLQPQVTNATANNRIVLRMLSTPADAVLFSGTLWFEEL